MYTLVHFLARLSIFFCIVIRPLQVQTSSIHLPSLTFRLTEAQSTEFLQKNVIFPGGEYVTNVIIANVEMLRHDDSNTRNFSSDFYEFQGMAPWPLWICHVLRRFLMKLGHLAVQKTEQCSLQMPSTYLLPNISLQCGLGLSVHDSCEQPTFLETPLSLRRNARSILAIGIRDC